MKKYLSNSILFLFLTIPLHAQLLFEEGFEKGNYSNWKEHIEGDGSTIEIWKDRARSGEYSVKFETRESRRAELVSAPNTQFFWGNEYWVGFSFYVENPLGKASIIYQHHSTPHDKDWSCNADPNSFTIKCSDKKNITILTATDSAFVHAFPTSKGGATRDTERKTVSAPYRQWHDVVLNFRDNPDSTGFLKVWLNGELIMDHVGPTVYVIDRCGIQKFPRQYMKIGLYPAVNGADGEIYYDEIRVGDHTASYELVKPRGTIKEYTSYSGDGTADEVLKKNGFNYVIDWAFKDDFNDVNYLDKWTVETIACRIDERDGLLCLDDSIHSEGVTIWLNNDLSFDNFYISAKARCVSEICNLNLMMNTREYGGNELNIGSRNGNYEDYHYGIHEKGSVTPPTQGYIATFTGNHNRLRKNPGFEKISESYDFYAEKEEWYEIEFIMYNGVLQYSVNNELVYEVTDPHPLQNGKFGIRSWHSKTTWDHIHIAEIMEKKESPVTQNNGGLKVVSVVSSSYEENNIPQYTFDGDLSTFWSALGEGEWIIFELDTVYSIRSVDIAFTEGNQKKYYFDISLSENGSKWDAVIEEQSNGLTAGYETFNFQPVKARYLKITCHENSLDDLHMIAELVIKGWPVNIKQLSSYETLNISPNPVAEIVAFTFSSGMSGEFDLKIYSKTGQVILNDRLLFEDGRSQAIIKNFCPGLYFIEVRNNEHLFTRHMLKI